MIVRSIKSTYCLPILATFMAFGCQVGPDYGGYTPLVPDVWNQELVIGEFAGEEEIHRWWSTFNDPILDELIARARFNNRDVYAAFARIQQSAAEASIAASPLLPFADGSGKYENFKLSENAPLFFPGLFPETPVNKFTTGLDVSWEPDVFGRISRSIESADAQLEASVEQYRDVLVCLYAEIGKSYVRLRALQEQKRYTLQNAELQRQSRQLAQDRFKAGLVPELDRHQAELNLARTQADVPRLEEAIQLQLNAIAALVGEFPGNLPVRLTNPGTIPEPTPIAVGPPLNLVRQRPDIRQAERRVAAQTARIGIAVSDLYPRFTIGGNFSVEAEDFSDLLLADSVAYGVSPSFRWAIFQGGRVRSNIAKQDAATEEAIARYEQTILNAFREVEDALAGYREERLRRGALTKAVAAATKAVENVTGLYGAGQTDFQNVLVTQQSLAQVQNQLADSEGRVAVNLVVLYKALGGGWTFNDHDMPHARRLQATHGSRDVVQPTRAETIPSPQPSRDTPTVNAPAVNAPANSTPAIDAPTIEPPAIDEPDRESPTVESPTLEVPAIRTPGLDAPEVERDATRVLFPRISHRRQSAGPNDTEHHSTKSEPSKPHPRQPDFVLSDFIRSTTAEHNAARPEPRQADHSVHKVSRSSP